MHEKIVVVGGGMIFVRELYLRRLECEYLLFREHQNALQEGIRRRIVAEISKELRGIAKEVKKTPVKVISPIKHQGSLNKTPKANAVGAKGDVSAAMVVADAQPKVNGHDKTANEASQGKSKVSGTAVTPTSILIDD